MLSSHLYLRPSLTEASARGVRCEPEDPGCQAFSSTTWSSNFYVERRPAAKSRSASRERRHEVRPSITSLSVSWQGTLRERQSLHFFCIISAPELSGYLDTKFWQVLLLQATYSDAAIKHAVAALGASHEHRLRKRAMRNNSETNELQPLLSGSATKLLRTS